MIEITEPDVGLAALQWLGELGYECSGGPDIALGEPAAERTAGSCR